MWFCVWTSWLRLQPLSHYTSRWKFSNSETEDWMHQPKTQEFFSKHFQWNEHMTIWQPYFQMKDVVSFYLPCVRCTEEANNRFGKLQTSWAYNQSTSGLLTDTSDLLIDSFIDFQQTFLWKRLGVAHDLNWGVLDYPNLGPTSSLNDTSFFVFLFDGRKAPSSYYTFASFLSHRYFSCLSRAWVNTF